MASKPQNSQWDTPNTAVSELAAPAPGASSPFGEEVEFPLAVEAIPYSHPTAAERPNLPVDES